MRVSLRRDCHRSQGTAPALVGHAPYPRPLPSGVACALLCEATPACRGFAFASLSVSEGQCTLAAADGARTRRVNVTTRCVVRRREGQDAKEAREAEEAAGRRAIEAAKAWIQGIVEEAEVGKIYTGKVVNIVEQQIVRLELFEEAHRC